MTYIVGERDSRGQFSCLGEDLESGDNRGRDHGELFPTNVAVDDGPDREGWVLGRDDLSDTVAVQGRTDFINGNRGIGLARVHEASKV